jgi:hypothetical protein
MTSDHLARVQTLSRMLIREAVRRATVSVGPGVKLHNDGRRGVVISR